MKKINFFLENINNLFINKKESKNIQQYKNMIINATKFFKKFTDLNNFIENCSICQLCGTIKNPVLGHGNKKSKVMFIGESPGNEENISKIPFTGKAGILLNNIFKAVGIKRDDVYITNLIKCIIEKNKNSYVNEINNCKKFLFNEIMLLKPKLIVTLGKNSSQIFFKKSILLKDIRKKVYNVNFIGFDNGHRILRFSSKLIPTFHPAFLVRTPAKKSDSYDDFITIKNQIIK